jgi:hypothetical protein
VLSAGGWDCTLEPGETLFMPLFVWHYVEYLSPALSVTYRLGRGRLNRLLGESLPAPSAALQSVGFRLRDEPAIAESHPEIVAALDAARGNREKLNAAVDAAYERLHGHSVETLAAVRALYLRELCG